MRQMVGLVRSMLSYSGLAQVAEESQCLVRDRFGLNDLHLKLSLALQHSHISPHSKPKMVNANVPVNANFHAKLEGMRTVSTSL